MATLKELSERTGYAPATISRILTGDPSLAVSPEARKKVLEEAGRLNYAATKSRRGRAPKTLMRAAAAERLTPEQQLEDPFYLYLRGHVEQACLDQRIAFQTLARRGEGFAPPEGAVDGVVAIGRFSLREAESLAAMSPNVVFLNASPDESRFDSVVLNYDLGIRLAVDHLLGLKENVIIGKLIPAGSGLARYRQFDWDTMSPDDAPAGQAAQADLPLMEDREVPAEDETITVE